MLEAEFPFSNSAVKRLEENRTNLNEISDAEISAAKKWILSKISGQPLTDLDFDRIKTFAISRIILAACANDALSAKFANELIKDAVESLQKDPSKLDWLSKDLISTIIANDEKEYGVGRAYSVGLFEFLEIDNAQMIRRSVENGRVILEAGELLELLRRIIRKRSILPSIDQSKIPKKFKDGAEELLKEAEIFLPKVRLGFASKTLELPCIKRIIEWGAEEGKRYYGSLAVSIACFKDNLSPEKAELVMKQYVKSCQKGSSEFTDKEGLATLAWVYKRKMNRISCRQLKQQGFGKPEECRQCKFKSK